MKQLFAALLLAIPGLCLAAPNHHHAVQASDTAPLQCVSWPLNIAPVMMQNVGLLKMDDIDERKTETNRLASQKVGPDLFVQVYDITFHMKSGGSIHIVTRNTSSREECSISAVNVYVVSRMVMEGQPDVMRMPATK